MTAKKMEFYDDQWVQIPCKLQGKFYSTKIDVITFPAHRIHNQIF